MRYEVMIKQPNGDYDIDIVKAGSKTEARKIVERSLKQRGGFESVESVELIKDWSSYSNPYDLKNIYGKPNWEDK
ncbi:MAG: hypothetical protein SOR93_14115 [Clostridiales Family XIII bacterium]|uniref:Uncharacterized protein n=1 Tax=Hominibacterium faecale TaxID=2839743 RepID=A0A9J6QYS8_9FIRM|nr:hypothetical protein [Hominibacterium faecale]MCI7303071.1 hypothetical protein [Clostridia bacterium]MCU7380628.1 hypothetical protein [Hominibacterium faecale]MDY3012373.1 hypothetical protein [Clostridiales Family XIII bacterium]